MLARKLGDVHETLDSIGNSNERAEGNELGDLTRSNLTDCVRASKHLPWVFLRCLERERNTLAVHVNFENFDRDFLTNLDNFTGVLDVLPAELRNVNETINATEVHEGTEVDDRRDDALANLTLLQVHEERAAAFRLGLLEQCTARENDVVAVLVELENLGFNLLAKVRREVADATELDE